MFLFINKCVGKFIFFMASHLGGVLICPMPNYETLKSLKSMDETKEKINQDKKIFTR